MGETHDQDRPRHLHLHRDLGVVLPGDSAASDDFTRTCSCTFAQSNELVAQGEWWRLFTAAFLHARSFYHVLFNMWALYVFGPQLERQVGSPAFAALYLSSAAAGGAAAFFLGSPLTYWSEHRARSSGFSAFGCGTPSGPAPRRSGRAQLTQLAGATRDQRGTRLHLPGISWQGHLGGLVAGVLIGSLWSLPRVARDPARRFGVAAAVGVITVLMVTLLGLMRPVSRSRPRYSFPG